MITSALTGKKIERVVEKPSVSDSDAASCVRLVSTSESKGKGALTCSVPLSPSSASEGQGSRRTSSGDADCMIASGPTGSLQPAATSRSSASDWFDHFQIDADRSIA